MLRGAVRHPEPDGLALVLPGEAHGGATRVHHGVGRGTDRVDVDVRREGPQPDGVDDDGGLQELQRLAVEDDAHVDELAAVDPRHGAQGRVDEGPAAPAGRSRQPPLGLREPREQVVGVRLSGARRVRRGERVGSSRVGQQPGVGHQAQHVGEEPRDRPVPTARRGRPAGRPREPGRGRRSGRPPWRTPRAAPTRGGSAGRRRGRWPRGSCARPAGWCSGRCGRRWRRRRPATRCGTPGRRRPRSSGRSPRNRGGSRRPG